jgi:hypothetical protein
MFYLCGMKYFHNSFPDKHNSIIVSVTKILIMEVARLRYKMGERQFHIMGSIQWAKI